MNTQDNSDKDTDLSNLRKEINYIDEQIVRLVNDRTKIAKRIGAIKKSNHMPIFDKNREAVVLERIRTLNKDGLFSEDKLQQIFTLLMDGSKEAQAKDSSPKQND